MSSSARTMPGWIMIVVVTSISVGAAGMVAGVYNLTRDRIVENLRRDRLRGIEEALRLGESLEGDPDEAARVVELGPERQDRTVTVYESKDPEREALGLAAESYSDNGYGGRIRLMVGINADGTVRAVALLEQSETPGLGARIRETAFLQQFEGKSLENFDFRVTKDGGEVDAITAATISSRAVAEAVEDALIAAEKNP